MKLLTRKIRKALPALLSQSEKEAKDIPIIVKFFCPWNQWTWYATEGNPALEDGNEVDFEFFGYVEGLDNELGYFRLKDLEGITHSSGLGIERDRWFDPGDYNLADVQRQL
jgi:hypothetical protein